MNIVNGFKQSGSLGTIIAAMGCASCFPAIAALGSALGLGFLAQFEGLFINTLLPIFAGIALVSYLYSGIFKRQWLPMLFGIAGPLMVLATLYLFWTDDWSTDMFYIGLVLMFVVAIWDIVAPINKNCKTSNCSHEAR